MFLPDNLDERVADAVEYFWTTRNEQIFRQQQIGIQGQGNRGAVTGGKQLDGFVNLICELLVQNNVPDYCIYTETDVELPGYYRPNKKWDLLVVDNHRLIAAIEFKSQIGPSFGNNFNNRTEEAMGSALDIWTAYREGVFGNQAAPWLGYFMVLEDSPKSSLPVRVSSPHFDVLPEFINASYKKRYEIFCSKLLLERQYAGVCLTTTSLIDETVTYGFPHNDLSFMRFITSMLGAMAAAFY